MLDRQKARALVTIIAKCLDMNNVKLEDVDTIADFNNAFVTLEAIASGDTIASLWSVDDVYALTEDDEGEQHPKLSIETARMALSRVETNHNAEFGINWDSLREALYEVLDELNEDPLGGDGVDD